MSTSTSSDPVPAARHECDASSYSDDEQAYHDRYQGTPAFPIAELKVEKQAYQFLVDAGGRPLFPIENMEQIIMDRYNEPERESVPEKFRPWVYVIPGSGYDKWRYYTSQWLRWEEFLKWQNDHRGIDDDDASYRIHYKRTNPEFGPVPVRKDSEPIIRDALWNSWKCERSRLWRRNWERGCHSFSDYVDAMRKRLAQHGFTGPFNLKENPKEQDSLTTWTEYFYFECWSLDWFIDRAKLLQLGYDKAWQDLLDTREKRYKITRECGWTMGSYIRNTLDMAHERIRIIESEILILTELDPRRVLLAERLAAAREDVDRTQKQYGIYETFQKAHYNYTNTQERISTHEGIVEWVREQFPLVEAESAQAKTRGP